MSQEKIDSHETTEDSATILPSTTKNSIRCTSFQWIKLALPQRAFAYCHQRMIRINMCDGRESMSYEWAQKDSNLRPTGYEPGALTTELWALAERIIP